MKGEKERSVSDAEEGWAVEGNKEKRIAHSFLGSEAVTGQSKGGTMRKEKRTLAMQRKKGR